MRITVSKWALSIIAAVVLSLWFGSVAAAARYGLPFIVSTDQATCRGERATHVVEGGETVMATSERDVIVVLGTGAEVWTQQGDDLVCVYGPGADSREAYHGSDIYAGPGNNTIITYGGSNDIYASTGNDLIYLNGNYETAEGHDGNDSIWALGTISAHINGNGGDDAMYGSPGNDTIDGGGGADFIMGNGGNDTLSGEDGSDTLFGGLGQDALHGGDGAGADFCSDHDDDTTFTDCENIAQPPVPPLPESS